MSDLVQWVSDELHDILGFSDRITSEFLISLAKKSSSGDAFIRKVKDTKAVKVNDRVTSFALKLWHKVPHQKAANPYLASREKERAAVAQQLKSRSYKMLSDDEEEADKLSRKKKASKEDKKERRARKRENLRRGKASTFESESSEEEKGVKPPTKRSKGDSDSDEWER